MMTTKRLITMPEHWRVWFRRVADGELPPPPDLPGDASAEAPMWFAIAFRVWLIVERSEATLEWDGSKALTWKKPDPKWKVEAEKAISTARTLCRLVAENPDAAQAARSFMFLALQAGDALVAMEAAFGVSDERASMNSYVARHRGGIVKNAKARERNQPTHAAIVAAMRAQQAMTPQPSRTTAAKHVAKERRKSKTGKPYSPRAIYTISEAAIPVWWRKSP